MSILGFKVAADAAMLGLVTGMLYGILGVGLILVFRSSRIINFAYGDIGALGAAILPVAIHRWHVPYWIAFLISIAISAGVGAGSEILVMRRLQGAPLVLSVIATLGLGQLLLIVSTIVGTVGGHGIGLGGTTYPQPAGFPQFHVGALLMTPSYTTMLILTPLVVLAIVLFLRRGRLGIAMRASAINPDAARMAGIAAGRLSSLSWAMAGGVAAFTAMLVLPARGFTNSEFLGPDLLLRGLLCAVVARMVSMPTALGAGLVLGVFERLVLANYPSGGSVEMLIFVAILVVLLLQRSTTGRSEDKGTWSAVEAFRPLPRSYREIPAIRHLGLMVGIAVAAVGLAIPELTSNTDATIFSLMAVIAIVGLSVTLITGLSGQLSLGQFGIAAVGAAAAYKAISHGAPFLIGVVAAALAGAAVSLVIGLPALRIRGLMLAVATLGFALAASDWLLEQPWMFGSGVVTRRPKLFGFAFDSGRRYFLVSFSLTLVVVWICRNTWRSGVGRRLRAVRDNEETARSFGVPATWVKLQAYVLSGVISGIAGALYSSLLSQQGSVAYPIDLSTNAVASSVIGGLGLFAGPLLGVLYIIGVPQWVPLDNVGLAATALGWLLLILALPGGIAQALSGVRDRIVDAIARRAGLDPAVERDITPGGGVFAATNGLELPPPAPRRVAHGEVLLQVEGVVKRFGGLVAVDNVSFDVASGEILGLIGPNGAGKTTTFELLGGFTRPDSGRITFEGIDITRAKPEQRADMGLIRSFQDAALFPTMTVHEVLTVASERVQPTRFIRSVAGLANRSEAVKARRTDELLGILGLLSYRDNKISELSTGTRRITELACLIALEPLLLLLDEPTSGIAQRETEALGAVLRSVKEKLDLTMVIIEHDIPLIMGLADRVVAMDAGQVLIVGSPAEVQTDPEVISSYLGGDLAAVERSGRASTSRNGHQPERVSTATDGTAPSRCGAPTRSGRPCQRAAGSDGLCAQHREVLSER